MSRLSPVIRSAQVASSVIVRNARNGTRGAGKGEPATGLGQGPVASSAPA